MKNFTNNFKQFTSRLSARWLIMALMLLLGTSSAWGKTVYYVNSNNWSSSNVKVYYWGGDKSVSWPGSVMTFTGNYVDGYEIYSYDVGTSTSCIFSNNGGNQTSDLTVMDGQYYYNGWKIASNLNIHNCVKDKFSISNTDVIYYDNSTTKWANCYVYIGHHSYSKVFDMTLVSGTRYLWKGTTFGTWSDAKGWYVSSEKWGDLVGGKNGDCIVGKACFHTNSTYTQPYKTDPGNGIVYKGSGTSTYKTDENNCSSTAYGWSSTKPAYSTTYTITLNIVGSGSVTIKNNAGTALFSNATANTSTTVVTYLTYLKNITATPSSGYALSSIKIGSTDYTSAYQSGSDTNNGYDLTGNVTITVTFEKTCNTPAAPTISNVGNLVLCNGSPTTNGKIKITTVNNGSTYYYKKDTSGTATKITSIANDGTFTVSAAGDYYVMEENDCGSESAWSTKVTITSTDNTPTISKDITISGTNWVCPGGSTELTANVSTTGTVSYSWTPNVGTTQNVTVFPTENTNYSVTVTVTNNGCSKDFSTTTPYAVTAYKVSSVTTNDAVQVTETTAMLSASNVTIGGNPSEDNISWGFELSTDGGATYDTHSVSYNNKGTSFSLLVGELNDNTTYSYRAYVKDKNCGTYYGEWKEFKTLVACTPTTVTISPNPIPSCNVGSLTLTATVKLQSTGDVIANPGGTFTWSKFGSNGAPSSIPGVTGNEYTVTESGKFYVTYNRGESNYCTSNSHNNYTTYTIVTIENPTASIEGDECVKSTGTTYSLTGSTFTTYEWVADPAASMTITGNDTATPTVKFNTGYTTGTLKFRGTTAAGCQSDWATKTLNAEPTVSPSQSAGAICDGETLTLQLSYTNATSFKWFKGGVEIPGQTGNTLIVSTPGTYYAKVFNDLGCSAQTENIVISDKFGSNVTPSIDGPASTQTGATATYTASNISGATYYWTLPTGWSITSGEGTNTITVSIPTTEGYGTVSVAVINNGCTKSATKEVQWMNGFTVYLRRPHAKNETTQYNYWFEKSNAAGPGYIKFGTVKASPSASELYEYNGGSDAETAGVLGTKGTESFTDCDGYVWDAYNIGIDVTALYFHAPNDKSTNGTTYGGYATYTRSYSQNDPISSDLYFTMGNWVYPEKGRTLTKVEKPFEGIEIEALGSTEICSNNMASFAALYLKSNCTGKEITDYAWKFSTNNSSWDEYTTGKGANTNNIRPNKAGYYHLECTLKGGSVVTSNSIQITTTTCSISNASLNNITSNLPIIMVNTGDKAFPSVDNGKHCSASADDLKKKRSVDVKILWNKNGTVTSTDAYSNGANLYYDRKARMNYRGSSSLNFEKKSFAFCPGDENCGQDDDKSADYVKTKKMNMFDLSGGVKDKDWVLYAAYVDPSMMRNILAMETYSAMTGKWGVKNQYVELYIDGEYQGVYVFMDKVTQNKKRVNIKWDVKDDTKREFILKFDKTDVADRYEDASGDQKTFESDMTGKTGISTYDTEVDQRFEIEYPEKEDIMDDGGYWSDVYSFVLGKVNEFESALSKGDFTTVRSLINYESWADFFILNEFTKNVDAYRASCIFVYTGGKFEAWPLWDYELSFNNTVTGSGKGRGETTGLLIEHSDVYSDEFPAPFWWTGKYNGSNMYSGLLKDPCFVQMIKSRWAEHTKAGGPLNPSTTTAKTAAYKTILDAQDAATREFTKWPVSSRGKDACNNVNTGYFQYGGGGANTTYANSYSQLNTWLGANARIKGLQAEIDELDDIIEFGITSTVDKDETTPWRAVNVTVDAVGADYTYTVTPEIIEGQVIQGSDNLLIYAEPATLPQTYTVVTTLNAKDQCGGKDADNASSTVTFTVNDLVENCEE